MKAIAVDTGGTFTDMVVLDQDTGALAVLKLPSTPDEPGRAIIDGIREAFANGVAPADVLSLSHGTTVGTNALLTGAGAHVGLFVTEGFGAINGRLAPRAQRGLLTRHQRLRGEEAARAARATAGRRKSV